jgi:hypothetical protein
MRGQALWADVYTKNAWRELTRPAAQSRAETLGSEGWLPQDASVTDCHQLQPLHKGGDNSTWAASPRARLPSVTLRIFRIMYKSAFVATRICEIRGTCRHPIHRSIDEAGCVQGLPSWLSTSPRVPEKNYLASQLVPEVALPSQKYLRRKVC